MSTPVKITLAVLLCVGVVALFIVTYVINKHTKEPEGCPKDDLGGCSGCMLSCSKREEDASLSKVVKNLGDAFIESSDTGEEDSPKNDNKGE